MIHDQDDLHTHQIIYLTAEKKACRLYTYNKEIATVQPVSPYHTPLGNMTKPVDVSLDKIQHLNADYVWWHQGDVYLQTNVPWLVRHHSPDGMAAGYGGSGPSDFALNILQWRLSQGCWSHIDQPKPFSILWDGEANPVAYRLHQDFKWEYLADFSDRQSGQVSFSIINHFIKLNIRGDEGTLKESGDNR